MRNETFIQRGKRTELDFLNLIKNNYPKAKIEISNHEQDLLHVDFLINNKKIDVKSIKNTGYPNNYTVVELINDKGYSGWVYADIDYVAFQSGRTDNYQFLMVDTNELRNYVKSNVRMITVDNLHQAHNKLYSRGNDLVAVVDMNYLSNLPKSFIIKNKVKNKNNLK